MEITIHQVICGQVSDGGFGCLYSTLSDESLSNSIAFKSDLQDPDGGIIWTPVIRGFLLNDNFLLIKTFSDKSLEARPGRNFSHVLVINKKSLQQIHNIEILFDYFLQSVDKSYKPEAITLVTGTKKIVEIGERLQKRFNKAIHGLHKLVNYKRTIIWVGQEGYEMAIAKLWQVLSPDQKLELNLGINFNIDAIKNDKLNFITIPDAIENKFLRTEYCIIGKTENYELREFAEQFLAGNDEALNKIRVFSETIQARKLDIEEIGLVAKVIPIFENIDHVTEFKKLLTLSSIIAEYSADSSCGTDYKAKLMRSIIKAFDYTPAVDLYLLKQFKTGSFPDGESFLGEAIIEWVKKKTGNYKDATDSNIIALFRASLEEKKPNWLSQALIRALKLFIGAITEEKVTILYSWFESYPNVLKIIKLVSEEQVDDMFLKHLNEKYSDQQLAIISDLAIENKWYRLLAQIFQLRFSSQNAIKEFFAINNNPSNYRGVDIVLEKASDTEIISAALEIKDSRLIYISAQLCHENNMLLNDLNTGDLTWLRIWSGAIENGNSLDDGILRIQSKVFEIYDLLLDDTVVDSTLWEKIVDSEYSSILAYEKRHLLWNRLARDSRHKILLNTLSNLVGSSILLSPQTDLGDIRSEVLKSDNLIYLFKRADTSLVIWLFKHFNALTESKLIEFLNLRAISLSSTDCGELGVIINNRRFESAFNLINDRLIHKNSNFNLTVNISVNTFRRKNIPFDFLEVFGARSPKLNHNPDIKTKILFLSANPNSTSRIRVDAELRKIDEALQASRFRDKFDLIAKGAVKFETFARAILEHNPQIIHFSGHADVQGIALETEDGEMHAVPNKALSQLFGLFHDNIRCVVLNACYTEKQAKVISDHGIYVIGMNDRIDDMAAINFSVGFYQGIWSGQDPVFSYEYAITHVLAKKEHNSKVPVLWYNGEKIKSRKTQKRK